MCGIAGFIKRDGEPEPHLLDAMAALLSHRGPDEQGVHLVGRTGLVHTRLSIIDLSGGHQPMLSRDPELALVANGEIYNYVELREELIGRGRDFLTSSDSETILQSYAAFGDSFIDKLHGMFAFALYDAAKRRLTLARDRLGIKPLYFVELPDRIAFASELKALLPTLPRAPEVNPGALAQFLHNQFNTGRETIFQGIQRLLPGEILTIDKDLQPKLRRYWSALEVEPRNVSYEDAWQEFDTLMDRVMRVHIRSDVPYGLFLSGGVDSGILASLLRRFQDKPIRSFSVGYTVARQSGELDDAQRVARLFGTEHTPLLLDQESVLRRLPHTVWAADDLLRDYACLPTSILAQTAAQELKVVFTGEGGDEVFAGYGRYRQSGLQRWLKNLVAPGSGGFRTRSQLRRRFTARLLKPKVENARHAVRAPFIQAWQATPISWSDVQRSQYTDIVTNLPDDLLVKADRMLMSFGLEGRVPFLDHRIVEFGLSLPDGLKLASRQGKMFLKRWAEQFLPPDHLYRRKLGFHVPIGEWLQGPYLDRLCSKLEHNPAIREWFKPSGVSAICRQQRSKQIASREIWSLMQFAIWHRLFIEHPGKRPLPEEEPLDWIS
jgi:asparagine synthase (glutamine-hydrolysing)